MQAPDHEQLDGYHLALGLVVFATSVIEGLSRGRSHLAAPFTRASMPVGLRIAEGPARSRFAFVVPPPYRRRFWASRSHRYGHVGCSTMLYYKTNPSRRPWSHCDGRAHRK